MGWIKKVAAIPVIIFLVACVASTIEEGITIGGSGVQQIENITHMLAVIFMMAVMSVIIWYLLKS